jgi:hypothetical protein
MCEEIFEWRNHYLFDKLRNYSFRVKYGDYYGYGKRDENCAEVCWMDEIIMLCSSMINNKNVEIKRKDIVEFEFGMFSGIFINNMFLYGCRLLTTPPTIPNSVTSIGDDFLCCCSSLTTPPTIPNSVTSIGKEFLIGCSSLTTPPTIPNSVTIIGEGFLCGCSSLTNPPTVPNSVTIIGDNFLYGYSSLTTLLTIPNSLTSIGCYFLGEQGGE